MSSAVVESLPVVESFPALSPSDRFRFSCQRCGECCFDQTVRLDPFDVFRLSRLTYGTTSTWLWQQAHLEQVLESEHRSCQLTMPRFGHRGRKCRHLLPELAIDGVLLHWSCDLHQRGAKPLVCSLSPLAKAVNEDGYRLVPPVDDCPGMGRGEETLVNDFTSPLTAALIRRDRFIERLVPTLTSEENFYRVFDFDRFAKIESLVELDDYLEKLSV